MSAAARTRGDRPAAPARTRAAQPRETRPAAARPGAARPAGRRPVGVVDVLRAELLRSRRTFTWGVVVATLALGAWAINLAHSLTAAGVVGTDARWGRRAASWRGCPTTPTCSPRHWGPWSAP